MSDAEHGGSWTEQDHLAGYYFDEPMCAEIAQIFGPLCSSVLDIGCGLGPYVRYLSRTFAGPCVGVEPQISLRGNNWEVRAVDLLDPGHHGDPWKFDLVLCVEVAEHIPREKHTALFDSIVGADPAFVVFSGATPGQTGLGHVACRPEEEWISEFQERDYELDPDLSARLRAAAYWGWFQKNTNVFRKG